MTTTAKDVGDLTRIPVAFTDVDGNPADPSAVTFRMTEPDGTLTSYVYLTDAELVKVSLGNYRVDWPVAQEGRHFGDFAGTGVLEAAAPFEFYALRSRVA